MNAFSILQPQRYNIVTKLTLSGRSIGTLEEALKAADHRFAGHRLSYVLCFVRKRGGREVEMKKKLIFVLERI